MGSKLFLNPSRLNCDFTGSVQICQTSYRGAGGKCGCGEDLNTPLPQYPRTLKVQTLRSSGVAATCRPLSVSATHPCPEVGIATYFFLYALCSLE